MRQVRTIPRIFALPVIFGAGLISWIVLFISLALIALVVLAPAAQSLRQARQQEHSLRATLALMKEKIAIQKQFISLTEHDERMMQRLADRQMDIVTPGEKVLPLKGISAPRDVQSLIARALKRIPPRPVSPLPWYDGLALYRPMRIPLVIVALIGLVFAFLVDVRRRD
jgi:cell division protein FtsB